MQIIIHVVLSKLFSLKEIKLVITHNGTTLMIYIPNDAIDRIKFFLEVYPFMCLFILGKGVLILNFPFRGHF